MLTVLRLIRARRLFPNGWWMGWFILGLVDHIWLCYSSTWSSTFFFLGQEVQEQLQQQVQRAEARDFRWGLGNPRSQAKWCLHEYPLKKSPYTYIYIYIYWIIRKNPIFEASKNPKTPPIPAAAGGGGSEIGEPRGAHPWCCNGASQVVVVESDGLGVFITQISLWFIGDISW